MTNGITKSFINIAINNQTLLSLNSCKINNDFSFCHLSGSTESKVIQVIYDGIFKNLQKETIKQYSENNTISDTKKRLLDEKYTRDLMHFADTTMYLHAGLVALGHLRNLEEIYKIQPEFFHNYLSKWRNRTENNEYYVQLKTEIDFLHSVHFPDSKSRLNWKMWFALALLVNLLLAGYIIYLKKQISRLEPDFQKNNTPTIDRLSPKEKEVYELLCKGLSNKEIGLNLFIETNTVKSHTAKIYRKLNVNSRDELIKTSK